jgi:hypothetical protein
VRVGSRSVLSDLDVLTSPIAEEVYFAGLYGQWSVKHQAGDRWPSEARAQSSAELTPAAISGMASPLDIRISYDCLKPVLSLGEYAALIEVRSVGCEHSARQRTLRPPAADRAGHIAQCAGRCEVGRWD